VPTSLTCANTDGAIAMGRCLLAKAKGLHTHPMHEADEAPHGYPMHEVPRTVHEAIMHEPPCGAMAPAMASCHSSQRPSRDP